MGLLDLYATRVEAWAVEKLDRVEDDQPVYCRNCGYETDWEEFREIIHSFGYPNCPECGYRKSLKLITSREEAEELDVDMKWFES